ncbi:hypothetical protein O9G_001950 [Rozella allomycis CSF55]|uniref:WH2 domain-containing protein n=1 Tax=Rozella allomycis (strain CSF55) TaxID=988480 RepID=A0A075AT89_ROZAC|nr:hypothetical protein O9G_001950 [Rozella allomycis CSF55]|eukprot:EPZ31940.1 hypothetical protein O9G_001950 [Rozella allomycis CSF55]
MNAPPPPPPMGGLPISSNPPPATKSRNDLLKSIEKGSKLKKTVTNDRSSPLIAASKDPEKLKSSSSASTATPSGGLGGLFAGGIPKLKPSGSSNSIFDYLEDTQLSKSPSAPIVKSETPAIAKRTPPPLMPRTLSNEGLSNTENDKFTRKPPSPPVVPRRSDEVKTTNRPPPPPPPSRNRDKDTELKKDIDSPRTFSRPPVPPPQRRTETTKEVESPILSTHQPLQKTIIAETIPQRQPPPINPRNETATRPPPPPPPARREQQSVTNTNQNPLSVEQRLAAFTFNSDLPTPRQFIPFKKSYKNKLSEPMEITGNGSVKVDETAFVFYSQLLETTLKGAVQRQDFETCISLRQANKELEDLKQKQVQGTPIDNEWKSLKLRIDTLVK